MSCTVTASGDSVIVILPEIEFRASLVNESAGFLYGISGNADESKTVNSSLIMRSRRVCNVKITVETETRLQLFWASVDIFVLNGK